MRKTLFEGMEIFAIFLNEVPTNLKLFMKYLEFGELWHFIEGRCKYLIFWNRVSLVKWSLQSPLLIVILLLKLGTGDKLYYLTSPMQSWVYKWSRYFGKNSSPSSIFYSFSQFHSDLWKIRYLVLHGFFVKWSVFPFVISLLNQCCQLELFQSCMKFWMYPLKYDIGD